MLRRILFIATAERHARNFARNLGGTLGPFIHWLLLFGFWLTLSGFFDFKHVGIGLIATAVIAFKARQMQLVGVDQGGVERSHLGSIPWLRVVSYSLWLLRAIASANWQVARLVLDPRLPIDPKLVRVPTRVRSDTAITLLANSITATPGTITVRAADDEKHEFVIHALVDSEGVAASVREMEERVLRALAEWSPR